ncbi:MAG: hypothetical protein R6X34_30105 [Chloroflexota bacterium]
MFEDIFTNVKGKVRVPQVRDLGGVYPPHRIIQTDDAWEILSRWEIDDVGASYLGGTWTVRIFAEAMGPGADKELAKAEVDLSAVAALPLPRQYEYLFEIPAFDVNPAKGLEPGVYKLVTVVNYANGGFPLEMAGFREGPIIQIYEEGN